MGRPKVHGDRVMTAVRFPVDLHERLARTAAERDVSVNHLMCRAIEEYLKVLPPVRPDSDTIGGS